MAVRETGPHTHTQSEVGVAMVAAGGDRLARWMREFSVQCSRGGETVCSICSVLVIQGKGVKKTTVPSSALIVWCEKGDAHSSVLV